VLSEIVRVGSINDGSEAQPVSDPLQLGPQLGFTEVAALGRIAEVARIIQLVGIDLEHGDVEASREFDCGQCLRVRVRCAPAGDREEPPRAQRPGTHNRQQR
jgi:hypothetical protein